MPKALQWFCVVRDTAAIVQQVIFNSELPVTMFVEKMTFTNRDKATTSLPDDYLYWAILLPTQLLGFNEESVSEALQRSSREIALDIASEWHLSLKCLIEFQDPSQGATTRIMSGPLDLPAWQTSDKVVLIGDAVHVMSPGGGVGVATALKDAATISEVLSTKGLSIESIGEYESAMRGYAEASIRRSFRGGEKFFGQPPFAECQEAIFKATRGK